MAKSTAKVIVSVDFHPCGAEFHPAFSRAIRTANGQFRIEYPINNKDMLKSQKAQMAWGEEKARHLRSWSGSYPTVTVNSIE